MTRVSYVGEKMYTAISCLCHDGPFAQRLEDATISALIRLDDIDLTGELADDLKYILDRTKRNIQNSKIQRELDELEIISLVSKMLHILLETFHE